MVQIGAIYMTKDLSANDIFKNKAAAVTGDANGTLRLMINKKDRS